MRKNDFKNQVVLEVPATCGNLGSGFDSYGLAINIYNRYTCRIMFEDDPFYEKIQNKKYPIFWDIDDTLKSEITFDKSNFLLKSLLQIFMEKDIALPPLYIKIDIKIPISRGLGSSANAIVAGLFIGREILRRFHDHEFGTDEIQYLAHNLEGHPDNITPAIFGGFAFCFGGSLGDFICKKIKNKFQLLY